MDRITVAILEEAEEVSSYRVESVDNAVAGISDKDGIGERTEIGPSLRNAPGRVQRAGSSKATDKISTRIKDAHNSITGARNRILFFRVLKGKRDQELVPKHLHAKRRKTRR